MSSHNHNHSSALPPFGLPTHSPKNTSPSPSPPLTHLPTASTTRKSPSPPNTYIRSAPLIPPRRNSSTSSAISDSDDSSQHQHQNETTTTIPLNQRDRRLSREWDAAHTVPSRFQKAPGSVWATPATRDGHVDRNRERVIGYREKVKEMTGKGGGRKGSV